ncbi:hypothetical protein FACS1894184_21290 [Clostridia bacterium]|nr:hypothetical protein FACS1894184_21290 [Clostridia bacterium]
MVGDFQPDASGKWSNGFDGSTVKGAVYPGNIAVSAELGSYSWWIPATATDAEAEAAEAFLAFILSKDEISAYCFAEGGTPKMWKLSDEFWAELSKVSPLMATYMQAISPETTMTPNFEGCIPSSVAAVGFGSLLPQLFDGTYTPEQFAQQLSVMAREAVED